MNTGIHSILLGSLLLVTRLCSGQTNAPADDWKSASSNQPGKEYPKVNSERRVKFRIVAPEATNVGVTFRDSSAFAKGPDGAWYGYTRPLDEGFHYYLLKIDGAEVPDPDQPHRAMAGLSMGAMETKTITLRNLDTFSHIGLFSGGSIAVTNITDLAAFKAKNRLVFVSYGSRELGGTRGGDPRANVEALREAGINSHFYVSPDTAHEWQSWRRSLREFAPLLFRK